MRRAALPRVAALLLALAAPGCGDDGVGKTYPVRGKVTLDSAPLVARTTTVLFKPDAAKGNTSPFEPAGTVDSEGNYTLYTKTRRGAAPGWYKVIVTATESESAPPAPGKSLHQRPLPRSLVPGVYARAESTPLQVEVVKSPAEGAYDLKLTK
jgi:hypothetical protein